MPPPDPIRDAKKQFKALLEFTQNVKGGIPATFEDALKEALRQEGTPDEIKALKGWLKKLNPMVKADKLDPAWGFARARHLDIAKQKAAQAAKEAAREAAKNAKKKTRQPKAQVAVTPKVPEGMTQTDEWQTLVEEKGPTGKIKVQFVPPQGTRVTRNMARNLTYEKDIEFFNKEWNPMVERMLRGEVVEGAWNMNLPEGARPLLGAVGDELEDIGLRRSRRNYGRLQQKGRRIQQRWESQQKRKDRVRLARGFEPEKRAKVPSGKTHDPELRAVVEKVNAGIDQREAEFDRKLQKPKGRIGVQPESGKALNDALAQLRAHGIKNPTVEDVMEYRAANPWVEPPPPESTAAFGKGAARKKLDPRAKDLSRLGELLQSETTPGIIPESVERRHQARLATEAAIADASKRSSMRRRQIARRAAGGAGGKKPPRILAGAAGAPDPMPGDPVPISTVAQNELGIPIRPKLVVGTGELEIPPYKEITPEGSARIREIHAELLERAASKPGFDPDLHIFKSPISLETLSTDERRAYEAEYRAIYGLDDILTTHGGPSLLDGGKGRMFGKLPTNLADQIVAAREATPGGTLPFEAMNKTEQYYATSWMQYDPDAESDVARYRLGIGDKPARVDADLRLIEKLQGRGELGVVRNFDIETTGLDPWGERMVSATIRSTGTDGAESAQSFYFDAPGMRKGLVDFEGEMVDQLEARMRHMTRLAEAAGEAPPVFSDFGEGVEQIIKSLLDSNIIMGQNIGFDYSFIVAGAKQHPRYKADPEFRALVARFVEAFTPGGENAIPIWDTKRVAMTLWGNMPLNAKMATRKMPRPFSMNNILLETDFLDWVIETLPGGEVEFEQIMHSLGGLHDDRFDTWIGDKLGQFQLNFLRGTGRNIRFRSAETVAEHGSEAFNPWMAQLYDRIQRAEAYTPGSDVIDMSMVPESMREYAADVGHIWREVPDAKGKLKMKRVLPGDLRPDDIAQISPLEMAVIKARQAGMEFEEGLTPDEIVDRFIPHRGKLASEMKLWTTQEGRITKTRRILGRINPNQRSRDLAETIRGVGAPFQGMHWMEQHLSHVLSEATTRESLGLVRKAAMEGLSEIVPAIAWRGAKNITRTAAGTAMLPFEVLQEAGRQGVFGDRVRPDFTKLSVSAYSYYKKDKSGKIIPGQEPIQDVGLRFKLLPLEEGVVDEEFEAFKAFLKAPDNRGFLDQFGFDPANADEYLEAVRTGRTLSIANIDEGRNSPGAQRAFRAIGDIQGGRVVDDQGLDLATYVSSELTDEDRNLMSLGVHVNMHDKTHQSFLSRQLQKAQDILLSTEARMRRDTSLIDRLTSPVYPGEYFPESLFEDPSGGGTGEHLLGDEFDEGDPFAEERDRWVRGEEERARVQKMDQTARERIDRRVDRVKTISDWINEVSAKKVNADTGMEFIKPTGFRRKATVAGVLALGAGYYMNRRRERAAPYEPTFKNQPQEKEDWYERYRQEAAMISGGPARHANPLGTARVVQIQDENRIRHHKMGPRKHDHLFGGDH